MTLRKQWLSLAQSVEKVFFPNVPNTRWVALRLLNADEAVVESVRTGELGQLGEESDHPAVLPNHRTQLVDSARRMRWDLPTDFHDRISERLYDAAQKIADKVQMRGLSKARFDFDRALDGVSLPAGYLGFPLMLAITCSCFFWITIEGANGPSGFLATLLIDNAHPWLKKSCRDSRIYLGG